MRGSIYKRSPNSYRIQWYEGRDANNKPIYHNKTISGPNAKKRAQEELNRVLAELQAGTYVEPEKMTVAELLRRWMRDHAKASGLAGSTIDGYESIIDLHLIPAFGKIELSKLKPIQIQEYYTNAQKSGGVTGKPLTSTTVKQHHAVLRKALKCAVQWQLIGRNAAEAVTPPKVQKHEMSAYTEAEIRSLMKATMATTYEPIILVANSTGMRLGEILSLSWDDIDPVANCIRVTKSLEQTKSGLRIKKPKSGKDRVIPVPSKVIDRLIAIKEQQEARAEDLGELWTPNNLVCPDMSGNYRKPDSMSSQFVRITKKAMVRPLGFHAQRHAHATILASQGWDAKMIQERLGHSTIAITMDIYTHVLPAMKNKLVESIEYLF